MPLRNSCIDGKVREDELDASARDDIPRLVDFEVEENYFTSKHSHHDLVRACKYKRLPLPYEY
jgi:hypothetical protein